MLYTITYCTMENHPVVSQPEPDFKVLVQEIKMLRNEMSVLKNEVRELRNEMSNKADKSNIIKIKFDDYYFSIFPSVNYLTMCDLNYEARFKLLHMFGSIDFLCALYLIDCWTDGLYDWDEKYDYDEDSYNFAHFVGRGGNESLVKYFLDRCIMKNLDLEQKTGRGITLLQMFNYNLSCCKIWDHVINTWIEKNLDMYNLTSYDLKLYKSVGGDTFLSNLCRGGTFQQIKRVTTVYVKRKYDLGHKNMYGKNCFQIACKYNSNASVKFMADTYVKQKLSLCKQNQTIDQVYQIRNHVPNSTAISMYLKCLEKDIYFCK